MRRERVPRRLVVGETVWLWSVGHMHTVPDAPGRPRYPDCREVLTVRRADARHAQLRIVFRGGAGRLVPDGTGPSGVIRDATGEVLNLHEPGVVRRLVDAATDRGVLPAAHGVAETDGWALLGA
ncbi:hypothetical protein [Streptomyces purpureus]|uniref:Uncharacterized protein n=1 Tax=Streptomyces purpureus TaxID=1951 RepID=A0A918LTN7_9ACTN|nr:hypothetical protein [Streptomyces purpureus]GGT47700.1 hypothetical protein GCM10014713_47160 [Streptomyces purpureus]